MGIGKKPVLGGGVFWAYGWQILLVGRGTNFGRTKLQQGKTSPREGSSSY